MVEKRGSILAIGSVMVDMVCRVPRLPVSGEGVVADGVQVAVGGCALNSANVIRQLNRPVFLFAPLGEGFYASFAKRELAARGFGGLPVSACGDGVVRDNGACLCSVEPDGERTMITMPGIERHFTRDWFERVDATQFASGFASGYELEGSGGDAIISFFEDHPALKFYYAPGPRVIGVGVAKTKRINALRPVWHLNDQEALSSTQCSSLEEAGFALARACSNAVVITAGAEGSHLFEGDRHIVVPTNAVSIVDTVGAGDAHLGALVAARTAGLGWEAALSLANKVAGAVCGVAGATLSDDEFAQLDVHL